MKKILMTGLILLFTLNSSIAYEVIYNNENGKFHDKDCLFAKVCTKNCTKIDIDDAIERGAKPCEKCRTAEENARDIRAYRKRKAEEERKRQEELNAEIQTQKPAAPIKPEIKKQGNFKYKIQGFQN